MMVISIRKNARLGLTIIGLFLLASCAPIEAAGDPDKGKSLAVKCAACHGVDGISMVPMYPNLAGQKQQYLINSLLAYRNGTRNNMVMSPQAMSLSDQDIEDLAAFYAQLDPAGGARN